MVLRPKTTHLKGESSPVPIKALDEAVEVDTFDGKLHIEWDPTAAVTPIGQLPFFIQFLKLGNRFEPWVKDCPLFYNSNNAPTKTDVLGSLLLSVLLGHTRYSHITTLMSDTVNSTLLGMNKVVSDDSAITSRPLLLSSVGRLTQGGRQKRMTITSSQKARCTTGENRRVRQVA